jgi:hypothetical protein
MTGLSRRPNLPLALNAVRGDTFRLIRGDS